MKFTYEGKEYEAEFLYENYHYEEQYGECPAIPGDTQVDLGSLYRTEKGEYFLIDLPGEQDEGPYTPDDIEGIIDMTEKDAQWWALWSTNWGEDDFENIFGISLAVYQKNYVREGWTWYVKEFQDLRKAVQEIFGDNLEIAIEKSLQALEDWSDTSGFYLIGMDLQDAFAEWKDSQYEEEEDEI